MGTVRARSMQMRGYIYLGTTPMYFLGASGRIVGSESNTRASPARSPSYRRHTLTHTHTYKYYTHVHARAVCMRMWSDTPEIYEQTSPVSRANRPASYGPIQFNFENKQPPLATSVNLFRGLAMRSYLDTGLVGLSYVYSRESFSVTHFIIQRTLSSLREPS